MHDKPVAESSGTFQGDWQPVERTCRCGSKEVQMRVWHSDCGGYEDLKFRCLSCGKVWWVEGSDS